LSENNAYAFSVSLHEAIEEKKTMEEQDL